MSLHTRSIRTEEAGTVARAYEFNNPMTAVVKENEGGSLSPEYSFLRVDQENVVIETAKMAEQGEELIIRLYECCNKRSRVVLTCGEPLAEASECNLMEEKDIPAEYTEHTVVFDMKPYEIKTIKVTWKNRPSK